MSANPPHPQLRRLVVLSGKGGAGKTTIACGLTRALRAAGHTVTLIDADAEAPDAATVMPVRWQAPQPVHIAVPEIDAQHCDGCGACAASCRFNALAMAGGRPLLFPDLCHGCGVCALICREHGVAIHERQHAIGAIRCGTAAWGRLIEARTAIGVARASQVITAALRQAEGPGLQVVDGPPGTACNAVTALGGSDLAVLVVESSPFGRHDATVTLELLRQRLVPHQVVINRASPEETEATAVWSQHLGLSIAATIPEDAELDQAGANGRDPYDHAPAFAARCRSLALLLCSKRSAA